MITLSSGVETAGTCPRELHPDDLLSRSRAEALADEIYDTDPNLVIRLSTSSGNYVLKWFGWRHRIHVVLSPTFPSRAWASWTCGQALITAGVRTPEPIWVYTRRQRGIIRENVYLTRAVEPHRALRSVLKTEPVDELGEILKRWGIALARMHNAGIYHRDLTTGNFLVSEENKIYVIDLNRARLQRNLSVSLRLNDLRKIHFPNRIPEPVRNLFWTSYGVESETAADWETLYQQKRAAYRARRKRKTQLKRRLRHTK